jgi:hypothetical protein
MIQIANLKIEPNALEAVPGSLARELCVLPLVWEGDVLRVVFGRRDDYREAIDTLKFVLNRRLACFVADFARIERAIDEVYTHLATEIDNCPLDFHIECPKRWLELRPTGRDDVRFCESCSRTVHLYNDENQAINQTRSGQCVAIFRAVGPSVVGFTGLIETIQSEEVQIPDFRAALRAGGVPWVAQAADKGDVDFLDTKIFNQGDMNFYDVVASTKSRSLKKRSEILERRDALIPYLGKPILHGVILFEDWMITAFVEKATGIVIHYELSRQPVLPAEDVSQG